MIPIPGTGNPARLEQNVAAANVRLTAKERYTREMLGQTNR